MGVRFLKIVRWLAVLGVVIALVATGAFFAVQSRSAADQYASIGAFFLALLTTGTSVMVWTRSAPGKADPPGPDQSEATVTIIGSQNIQTGPKSRMNVRTTYALGSGPGSPPAAH